VIQSTDAATCTRSSRAFSAADGTPAFEADSPTHVVMMHLTVPVPDPREVAPARNIPNAIVDVVFKALQKDVRLRYQDAIEFADALREAQALAESHPPSGRRSLPPGPSSRPMVSVACTHCGLSSRQVDFVWSAERDCRTLACPRRVRAKCNCRSCYCLAIAIGNG